MKLGKYKITIEKYFYGYIHGRLSLPTPVWKKRLVIKKLTKQRGTFWMKKSIIL